jgi:hypothetical protein
MGDQAGGQNWGQGDRATGGSGQGSACGAQSWMYQLKEKPVVTDLGGMSGSVQFGGTSGQEDVR